MTSAMAWRAEWRRDSAIVSNVVRPMAPFDTPGKEVPVGACGSGPILVGGPEMSGNVQEDKISPLLLTRSRVLVNKS
jgi:hypothetical protein